MFPKFLFKNLNNFSAMQTSSANLFKNNPEKEATSTGTEHPSQKENHFHTKYQQQQQHHQ